MISKRFCIALFCVLAVIFTGCTQVSSGDKAPAAEKPAAKQETAPPAADGKTPKQESAKPAADGKTTTQETSKPPADAKSSKPALPYVIAADDFSNLQLSDAAQPVYDAHTLSERIRLGLPVALPALSPYHGPKTAYLTFDDGPDDEVTPAILDILASYDHDYDRLYASTDDFLYEMEQTDEILHGILGFRPLILRAPGGASSHFTDAYEACLKENGYVEHDWNSSAADTAPGNPTAQDFIDNISSQTADGKESAIILMHSSSGHQETARALPEIIRVLREYGYQFGVVTPMTPQPW